MEVGSEGGVYPVPQFALWVKPQAGFFTLFGALHQKGVLYCSVLDEGFEGSGTEFFWLAVVVHAGGFVGFCGVLEQGAGVLAGVVQQDGLVAGLQALVQRVLDGVLAGEPLAGGELAPGYLGEQFVADVVVEGMKPFVGDAAGAGVFGQGEAAGGGGVMGRHPRAAANAVLQGQSAAQGDQAFCAAEDGHQVAQGIVEQGGTALFFRLGHPAANLDGSKLEPPAHV